MRAQRLIDLLVAAVLIFLILFGWIHDTKLAAYFGLAQVPRCERPRVFVISCANAVRDRATNAKNLIDASPYPAELLPCVDAPGGAITSSPHSQLDKAERSLFQSHLRAIAVGLEQLGDDDGCILVLEDDAVVDWSVVARVVAESAALGEPWDVLNLHNKRWEGARSWWMTDRAFRLGCVHRAIHSAGNAYTVGLLYSKRGAESIARAAQAEWEQPYDMFLGDLSMRRLLRIMWWGCASRPLRHETFGSTFAHTNRRNPLDEDERPPHQHRRNASSLRRG